MAGETQAGSQLRFASGCDAEVIVKFIGEYLWQDRLSEVGAFSKMMRELPAAYSLVAITPEHHLVAARDPYGFRPLWWVKTDEKVAICSESALLVEHGVPREVKPGSLLIIESSGKVQEIQVCEPQRHECLMERFYFSRPDSHQGNAGSGHPASELRSEDWRAN